MDQNPPPPATAADAAPSPAPAPAAVSATPSSPQLQPQPSPPQPPSSSSIPNPNPNPNPRPAIPPPARPQVAAPRPPSSSSAVSASVPPRPGGIALGVPAHRPIPPALPQGSSFSPSYGHFGGLARNGVGLTDSSPSSNVSQVRPAMSGIGMLGSLNSGAQIRPSGVSPHHPLRPVQSSLRPVAPPGNQVPSPQNFQGHGSLRMQTSVGSPSSSSPNTQQSVQSLNQPWLASGPQGKPPLPTPIYRQPVTTQSLQLRPLTQPQPQPQPQSQPQPQPSPQTQSLQPLPQRPQQLLQQQQQQQHSHPIPVSSLPQQISSLQPQPQQPSSSSSFTNEHLSAQVVPPRAPHTITHQQQATRIQNTVNPRPPAPASVQPITVQPISQNRILTTATRVDESCGRILSKRSIHELINQVDPSEKLDPEVEEILMDIADDFVESITTFGCSLAKHRKSTTLEAKDILLHLERNWSITLPGFTGDEIKSFRKPHVNDAHKERLAAVKKSMYVTEMTATRNPGGQAAGNSKGVVKAPATVFGSPNVKI